MPIIQRKILEGSTIHTDGWKPYDDLIVNGYTHYLVFHHENEFVRGKSHVNGIESFWSFAQKRLAKFNGLTDENLSCTLKNVSVSLIVEIKIFQKFFWNCISKVKNDGLEPKLFSKGKK